jgi:hypothetical protein
MTSPAVFQDSRSGVGQAQAFSQDQLRTIPPRATDTLPTPYAALHASAPPGPPATLSSSSSTSDVAPDFPEKKSVDNLNLAIQSLLKEVHGHRGNAGDDLVPFALTESNEMFPAYASEEERRVHAVERITDAVGHLTWLAQGPDTLEKEHARLSLRLEVLPLLASTVEALVGQNDQLLDSPVPLAATLVELKRVVDRAEGLLRAAGMAGPPTEPLALLSKSQQEALRHLQSQPQNDRWDSLTQQSQSQAPLKRGVYESRQKRLADAKRPAAVAAAHGLLKRPMPAAFRTKNVSGNIADDRSEMRALQKQWEDDDKAAGRIVIPRESLGHSRRTSEIGDMNALRAQWESMQEETELQELGQQQQQQEQGQQRVLEPVYRPAYLDPGPRIADNGYQKPPPPGIRTGIEIMHTKGVPNTVISWKGPSPANASSQQQLYQQQQQQQQYLGGSASQEHSLDAMPVSPKEQRRRLMTGTPSTSSSPARRGTLEVGKQMQRLQQEDPRLSNIENRLKRIQQLGWAAGSAPPTPTGKASGGLGSKLFDRQQQAYMQRLTNQSPNGLIQPMPLPPSSPMSGMQIDQRMLMLQPGNSGAKMHAKLLQEASQGAGFAGSGSPRPPPPHARGLSSSPRATAPPLAPPPSAVATKTPEKKKISLMQRLGLSKKPVPSAHSSTRVQKGDPEYEKILEHACRTFFARADHDGGGTISPLEFSRHLKEAGKLFKKEGGKKQGHTRGQSWFDQPMGLYQKIDNDDSGSIDVDIAEQYPR